MAKINHALKLLVIIISVFFIGYLLESYRSVSPVVGDYFEVSTELLPLVVSFSIFFMTWLSYKENKDNHSLFMGFVFFLIGILDLYHMVSYPFMPDFITSNSSNKAAIFWSEARLLSALLFLASVYVYKDTFPRLIKIPALFVFTAVLSFISLITTSFYPEYLPVLSYFDRSPSTTLKFLLILSAVIISYACYLYAGRLKETGQKNLICLMYGFIITAFSDLVYLPYDYSGTLLKAAGFYFLYLALFKSSIEQPYENQVVEKKKLLYETEEKYRSIFDNAYDAVITVDLEDIVTSWNRSAERIFGWKAEEAIGKQITKMVVPHDLKEERECLINDARSGKVVAGIETERLRKDGTRIDVSSTISPLRDADQNIIGFSSVFRDITERKRAEERLEKLNACFLGFGPDPIENIRSLTALCGELMGATYALYNRLDEEVLCPWGRWNTPSDYNACGTEGHICYDVINRGSDDVMVIRNLPETKYAHTDPNVNAYKLNTYVGKAVKFGKDYVGSLCVVYQDDFIPGENDKRHMEVIASAIGVEENRKYAIEALQQSEGKYRTLIENIQDGVFIIQDDKIQLANDAFARLTGYTLEEVIGKDFHELVAPEDLGMVADRYYRRQAGEDEFRVLQKNGTKVIVNMNVGLITYRGRVASMGTVKNITERKLAEEQIKESLKEKEILLREIHHRVKNNMQIISSLLRLQSGYVKEEKYLEMFKDSQNRIISMSLIHEKLYQSKDFAKIDFDEYIKDMVNGLYQSYGTNTGKIALNINVKDVSLGVDTAIPCGLIINELVTNSLKHAFPDDRKGKITISLCKTEEEGFELAVGDNGIGIPKEINLRNTQSLGLYLVTILAENQLQGEINFDRSNGTEFQIKFKGEK